jgi:hypothetical protein
MACIRILRILSVFILVPLVGCGDAHQPGSNDNTCVGHCTDDLDCPAGWVCVGTCCQPQADAGGLDGSTDPPQIAVDPQLLSFAFAPLGVDVTLPVTVSNLGGSDLEITAIVVTEPDSLQEFSADLEGTHTPPLVVAPGATLTIAVTLRQQDAEIDVAQLVILSNDPDDPSVTVDLLLDCKCCEPDLDVCAMDGAVAAPEPFVDCTVSPVTGDPIIDFGIITSAADASRLVAIHNIAENNLPLVVHDIHVTTQLAPVGTFSIEFFRLEEDPVTHLEVEVPTLLPAYLSAGDPVQALPEDRLFVRLWLHGPVEGLVPAESLVIGTNDLQGELAIPIYGVSTYCPPYCWDINNDPLDGCEICCVFQQATDSCSQPGVDLNCDGQIDQEDVDGCTPFYLDLDSDTYGVTTDSRCLCTAGVVPGYTATLDDDCNDGDALINPGASETCDGTDNNCDGSVDEGFDLQTDPLNCGFCGNPCQPTEQCVGGFCGP